MNKLTLFSVLFCLLIPFLGGCNDNSTSLLPQDLPSYKINNLFDADGDKRSDFVLWNTSSMSGSNKFLEQCFFETIIVKTGKYLRYNFGEIGEFPVSGYFDGDNILDIGLYNRNNEWILKTANGNINSRFGEPGDVPSPGDFDGDGKFDIVTYRNRTNSFQGILTLTGAVINLKIGSGQCFPVVKDYDGDGLSDFAVYNLSNGLWTIKSLKSDKTSEVQLGGKGFLPIPSDYDGDRKADVVVWNFNDNSIKALLTTFQRPLSENTVQTIQKELKKGSFFPVSADYDGDGASELSFWNSLSKTLTTFDLRGNDLKKKTYHLSKTHNSLPINNFALHKLLLKNKLNKNSILGYGNNLVIWLYDKKEFNGENIIDGMNSQLKGFEQKDDASPFVSDFDGDYVNESCLWSEDTNIFKCNSSRLGYKFALPLGLKHDRPIVGNFNSDNISDIGVYRPALQTFYIRYLGKFSPEKINSFSFERKITSSAIPQINDYDGDGIDDLAVYEPGKQVFIIKHSSDFKEVEISLTGKAIDPIPLSGDFDGDGIAEPALISLKENKFNFYSTSTNMLSPDIGLAEDLTGKIFSADFDNDYKSDIVSFNSDAMNLSIFLSSGEWHKNQKIKLKYQNTSEVKLVNCPWLY